MHLFEVRKNGIVMMYSDHKECINTSRELESMKKNGYRVYINGKSYKSRKDDSNDKE